MPVIELVTLINAPIGRVFDLSRSVDLHVASTAATSERAVAGVTSGLIGTNQEVTWEATHFFIRQRLTSRITRCERPDVFEDEMVSGAFKRMWHRHEFFQREAATEMRDHFEFEAPLGILGRIAERLFLIAYLRRLLMIRNSVIRQVAETDEWQRFLPYEKQNSSPESLES